MGVEFGLGCAALGEELAHEYESSEVEEKAVEVSAEQFLVACWVCAIGHHAASRRLTVWRCVFDLCDLRYERPSPAAPAASSRRRLARGNVRRSKIINTIDLYLNRARGTHALHRPPSPSDASRMRPGGEGRAGERSADKIRRETAPLS